MTGHPNLGIATAGYEAFAAGDLATVSDLFSDDIVWHSGENNVLTGDCVGKEAAVGFFDLLMQESGGSFRTDTHDMLANGEHGVALVTVSATRGGKSLEDHVVHVFHMSDGKMKESWAFSENPNLYDEFWASPNRRVQKTCERSNTHRIGYVSAPPCAAWRHALSGRMWKPPPVCVRRGEHARR